jgi:hypothetical protein
LQISGEQYDRLFELRVEDLTEGQRKVFESVWGLRASSGRIMDVKRDPKVAASYGETVRAITMEKERVLQASDPQGYHEYWSLMDAAYPRSKEMKR